MDLGTFLYHQLAFSDAFLLRIVFSVIGCTFLCLGVAIYITVDIGVDPFTGLVLVLWGVIKKEYRYSGTIVEGYSYTHKQNSEGSGEYLFSCNLILFHVTPLMFRYRRGPVYRAGIGAVGSD